MPSPEDMDRCLLGFLGKGADLAERRDQAIVGREHHRVAVDKQTNRRS